jgi:hypothetical protein
MPQRLHSAGQRYFLRVYAYRLLPDNFRRLAEVGEHPLTLAKK